MDRILFYPKLCQSFISVKLIEKRSKIDVLNVPNKTFLIVELSYFLIAKKSIFQMDFVIIHHMFILLLNYSN